MSGRLLAGVFSREADILAATRAARERGYDIVDIFTPYAVHGLDRAQGLRPSRLPWVCFLCGLGGGLGMLLFMFWASAVDWPINIGGKPWNSLPAFVPIWFELTVLSAGLGSVAALCLRCGLLPGRKPVLAHPRVTDDRFVLVVRSSHAGFDTPAARRLFEQHRAVEIEERLEEEDG